MIHTFKSKRTDKFVTIVMTSDSIIYIEEGFTSRRKNINNRLISFNRWNGCHLDELHLKVDCVEIYNDPRFEYWLQNDEFENTHIHNLNN